MSARREKRLRRLERRVTDLEAYAKANNLEIDYWRKRAFKAELAPGGDNTKKTIFQKIADIFRKD